VSQNARRQGSVATGRNREAAGVDPRHKHGQPGRPPRSNHHTRADWLKVKASGAKVRSGRRNCHKQRHSLRHLSPSPNTSPLHTFLTHIRHHVAQNGHLAHCAPPHVPPLHGYHGRVEQGPPRRRHRGHQRFSPRPLAQGDIDGQGAPQGCRQQDQDLPRLQMEPRPTQRQAQDAELHPRPQQDRPHDAGCSDQNQERAGPYSYFPPIMQRGHLRFLRNEH
jgi:hypothetical protein